MAQQTRILNCIPSRNTERDWRMSAAMAAGVLKKSTLPVSVDLRAPWWKVANQGTTGSCVGWAAADSVIRWHFVRQKKIRPQDLLSSRFLWMSAKETDEFRRSPTTFLEAEGTSLKAALDIARKYGNVLDKHLPFSTGALFSGDADTFYAIASGYRISSYFNLGTDPKEWRRWIATGGPILTRLDCDETWDNITNDGKLTHYKKPPYPAGHAIALVGYTPDGFIVRNSWGSRWGDKGFAYASNEYAAAAFTEAYGVQV